MKLLASVLLLFSVSAWATVPPTSSEQQYQVYKQFPLSNPGFELGKTGYSASGGTFAINTTASNVSTGIRSGSWDASASGQTLSTSLVAIPVGLYGANCLGRVKYKGGDANLVLEVTDGTNTLSSLTLSTVASFTEASVSFVCPTSGSLLLRLRATADAAIVYVDDLFIGENYKLGTVAQASLYGSVIWPGVASCAWSRTSNQSFADYSAVAACTSPTGANVVGNASAPATKIPAISFNSLPPGDYLFIASGGFYTDTSANQCSYRFSDGTNGTTPQSVLASSGAVEVPVIVGRLSYTSAAARTISIQATGTTASQACDIDITQASTKGLEISVYRFPSSSEQAYRADQVPASWSGYHDNTCAWSRTNAAYGDFTADATCALVERTNRNFGTVSASGSILPAITFTPPRVGRYLVVATPMAQVATAGTNGSLRLWDGTTVIAYQDYSNGGSYLTAAPLIGVYNATSVSSPVTLTIQGKAASGAMTINGVDSSINWSIVQLDTAMPAPFLVNSILSNTSGQERIERAAITSAGAISSQSGTWLSAASLGASSQYSLTITGGMFSATPACVATATSGGSGATAKVFASSTSALAVETVVGTSPTNASFNIICMGPK